MSNQSKLIYLLLFVGLACLAFGSYSYFYKPTPQVIIKEQSTKNASSGGTEFYSKRVIASKRVEVPASQMWFNTGIDVTGKYVRIAYESGKWKNHPDAWESDGEGCCPWPDLLVPNAPLRSLVGKTDDGIFYVGNFP